LQKLAAYFGDLSPNGVVMQVVKFSISLPDETHPTMQVHISGPGITEELSMEIPVQSDHETLNSNRSPAVVTFPASDGDVALKEADDYVLGGYAGI
jgi:hypothetical protein